MKKNTWFTSDTHFGHRNIIKYSNRPYAKPSFDQFGKPNLDDQGKQKVFLDVDRMDEDMISRWNRVVRPGDTVYHLGDFAMGKKDPEDYLRRLNGDKHFIWGNHDSEHIRTSSLWESSQPALEIRLDGQYICMFHYGCRVWNRSHHGALMFYGHSHGSLPGNSQSLDVGADCWDLTPVSLTDIRRRLRTLPTYQRADYHGGED